PSANMRRCQKRRSCEVSFSKNNLTDEKKRFHHGGTETRRPGSAEERAVAEKAFFERNREVAKAQRKREEFTFVLHLMNLCVCLRAFPSLRLHLNQENGIYDHRSTDFRRLEWICRRAASRFGEDNLVERQDA